MSSLLKAKSTTNRFEKLQAEIANPEKLARITCMLDNDLMRRFKSNTASNGLKMTEVITTMIEDYLAKNG